MAAKKSPKKKPTAKKAPAKVPAKAKASSKKGAAPAKKAPAKKPPTKKVPAKKAPSKKGALAKTASTKKASSGKAAAPAKAAPAKQAAKKAAANAGSPAKASAPKPLGAHKTFGTLAPDGKNLTWADKTSLGDREVAMELSVPSARAASDLLDNVAPFVEQLGDYDARAREALRKNVADGGAESSVELYRDHHLEEVNPKIISTLFKRRKELVDVDTFLGGLHLTRVGLRPDKKGCAIFDYTIGKDITDYLLVVTFDAHGKPLSVAMES